MRMLTQETTFPAVGGARRACVTYCESYEMTWRWGWNAGGEGSQFLAHLKMADRRAASIAAAAPPSAAAALAQLSGSPSIAPKLSYSGA